MKKYVLPIVVFVAILVFILIGLIGLSKLDEWDSPLGWAKAIYPLGDGKVYILQENPEVNLVDGKVVAGSYYFIALPDDEESQYEASGRQIGKSDVSLEQYVGKRVHIFGNFYEGYLHLRKQSNQPTTLRGEENVLIYVNRVELAE